MILDSYVAVPTAGLCCDTTPTLYRHGASVFGSTCNLREAKRLGIAPEFGEIKILGLRHGGDDTTVRRAAKMPDEDWIKTLEDGRKVKFTSQELPRGAAFITAQIAGNKVVYSIVLRELKNPLSHDDVEAHLKAELAKR